MRLSDAGLVNVAISQNLSAETGTIPCYDAAVAAGDQAVAAVERRVGRVHRSVSWRRTRCLERDDAPAEPRAAAEVTNAEAPHRKYPAPRTWRRWTTTGEPWGRWTIRGKVAMTRRTPRLALPLLSRTGAAGAADPLKGARISTWKTGLASQRITRAITSRQPE